MKIILKIFQIVQSHSRRRRFVPQRDHTLWTKVRLSSCNLMTDTTILQVRRERAQCPVYSQHRELDDLAPDRPPCQDPLRAHQWPLPSSRGLPRHPGGDGGIQDGESQSWLSGHLGCIISKKIQILPQSRKYKCLFLLTKTSHFTSPNPLTQSNINSWRQVSLNPCKKSFLLL